MTQEREMVLVQSMGKLFVRMAIPGMIGTLIMGLYNFVDAIFVGQFVGASAVGAVGLLYTLVIANQGILVIMGSGSGAVLSIAIGKQDNETIKCLLGTLIPCTFIMSTVFAFIIGIWAEPVVYFLGGSGELLDKAVKYLVVLVIGMPFMATGAAMNMLLRGEGKLKVAMMIASGSFIMNIILDPILILWAGWGIEGAAWATVLSQIAYFLCQVLYHSFGNTVLKLKLEWMKVSKKIFVRVLKAGYPAMLMQVMGLIQIGLLYKVLASMGGADHISLITGSLRCYMLVFFIITGIAYGMQPVVGINYGAGDFQRVRYAWKYFTAVSMTITFTFWVVFMTFPGIILSWFISDPLLVEMGVPYFRILNLALLTMGALPTTMFFFMAIEKPKPSALLAIGRQVMFFIPLLLVFSHFMGVKGVWISMPVTDLLTVVISLVAIVRGFNSLPKMVLPSENEILTDGATVLSRDSS